MKQIFTGDWHFGLRREETIFDKTTNELILDSAMQILKYAIENKIKKINILGDIFHRSQPTAEDTDYFARFLNACIDDGVAVTVLAGNHEANEYSKSALVPLEKFYKKNNELIEIVNKNKFRVENNVNFIIVPHIHNKDLEKGLTPIEHLKEYVANNIIKDSERKIKNVLLGHFHVAGSLTGSEERLIANSANTVDDNYGLDLIICGHIHKHQWIEKNKTIIPGSIIVNDFGEMADKKGFVVYDFDKFNYEFVELDTFKWAEIEIDLSTKKKIESFNESKFYGEEKIVYSLIIKYSDSTKNLIDFNNIEKKYNSFGYVKKVKKVNVDEEAIKVKKVETIKLTPSEATKIWLNESYPDVSNLNKTLDLANSIISKVIEKEV